MIDGLIKHTRFLLKRTDDRNSSEEGIQGEQNAALSEGHRPIIGIPVPIQQSHQGPLLLADAVGAWAVERMLGSVFLIPLWPFPTHQHMYQSLWSLMQSMDGLLLPAGIQETSWYTLWREHENDPGPQCWPICWEIALAQLATYIGMPILAIGDGAEKWNIALGGCGMESPTNLLRTVPTTPETWDRHSIRVRTQSKLAVYIQQAFTAHDEKDAREGWTLAFMLGQGVEKLAPGLHACAQSEQAAIVAFERADAAFGLGIVGRLDWGLDQPYGTLLFETFLHECRSFARIRQQNQTWESSRDAICTAVYERVAQHQPLIVVPQSSSNGRNPRSRYLSGALSSSPSPLDEQHERLRHRSHQPTKDELNLMRRRKLKITNR